MRHGRADYNEHVQDGGKLIGEDEPVFLLRAQDHFAPHNLLDYAARADETGLTEMAAAVRKQATAMREWQQAHPDRVKHPDLPAAQPPAAPSPAKKPRG